MNPFSRAIFFPYERLGGTEAISRFLRQAGAHGYPFGADCARE